MLSGRLRLPVICLPLFIISKPELVIAQRTLRVVGLFLSLNARPISLLDEWPELNYVVFGKSVAQERAWRERGKDERLVALLARVDLGSY